MAAEQLRLEGVPVHRVERVLDQQAEVGVAFHQQAPAEEQGVGILLARQQSDSMEMAMLNAPGGPALPPGASERGPDLLEDLANRANRGPHKRLEQMIDFDEEQAAAILRQWLRNDKRA